MGVSRDTFYRYQGAVSKGGVDALLNANRRVPNIKNSVDENTEVAVVQYAAISLLMARQLYTIKTPITATDRLNDKVLPFFIEHKLPVLRILKDRGTEFCGKADRHDYLLYLAVNDIDHTKTKVRSPQANGICERSTKRFFRNSIR